MNARLRSLAFLLSFTVPLQAEIPGLPRLSPGAVSTQTIGVSEVSIEYHRPRVNGRNIFGGLVPNGSVWRAGANDNTRITFSNPVEVEGQPLAAGTYGLHMIPDDDQWQIIFSKNSTSWGSFSYDQSEDALRVPVTSRFGPFRETLEYGFEDLTSDSATILLRWAELEVPFRIRFDTEQLVLTLIRQQLRSTPGFTYLGYQSAASYCLNNDIHLDQALEWIDRSISMTEAFSNVRIKAALLEKLGRSEEAAEQSERMLEIANEAQVNFLGYFYLGQGDAGKARAMFEKNVSDYPESWNVYDSLAELQANSGQLEEAIANYTTALEMAPEAQQARIEGILENLRAALESLE